MQPGDSGGGERRYGYGDKTEGECSLGTVVEENGGMDDGDKTEGECSLGTVVEENGGMDDGDKTEGECSLGTVVEENGGMDTEIRQRVSAAWGQWWRRTEVWIRR